MSKAPIRMACVPQAGWELTTQVMSADGDSVTVHSLAYADRGAWVMISGPLVPADGRVFRHYAAYFPRTFVETRDEAITLHFDYVRRIGEEHVPLTSRDPRYHSSHADGIAVDVVITKSKFNPK